jgi:antitoxin component YwqK of YwqJK toxin-antitoxin module
MNTYFALLDKSSLFEILIRMHYPDVETILIARPYLKDIVKTNHFEIEWTKYNVSASEKHYKFDKSVIVEERDRLGELHGSTSIYWVGSGLKIEQYKQGLLHGNIKVWSSNGILIEDSRWAEGAKEGLDRTWRDDGTLVQSCLFKHNKLNGVSTYYHNDGGITIAEYLNDFFHGCVVAWYANGQRESIRRCINGKLREHTVKKWDITGQLITDAYF